MLSHSVFLKTLTTTAVSLFLLSPLFSQSAYGMEEKEDNLFSEFQKKSAPRKEFGINEETSKGNKYPIIINEEDNHSNGSPLDITKEEVREIEEKIINLDKLIIERKESLRIREEEIKELRKPIPSINQKEIKTGNEEIENIIKIIISTNQIKIEQEELRRILKDPSIVNGIISHIAESEEYKDLIRKKEELNKNIEKNIDSIHIEKNIDSIQLDINLIKKNIKLYKKIKVQKLLLLASYYQLGDGIEQDIDKAIERYKEASLPVIFLGDNIFSAFQKVEDGLNSFS